MNDSLSDFLIKSHDSGIHTLARFIARYVSADWERVFEESFASLSQSRGLSDDAAYALYAQLLFAPLNQALERVGFAANPALPGNFSISREWGPEHERQRWLWSKITAPRGEFLGTILVIFYHDHTRLSIPRPPLVLPLQDAGINKIQPAPQAVDQEMLLQI